ncbi:hypothetical protein Acr_29g0006140 [Actinidia rufa]|uniref:Uncharacterized protein n=1 Tax=Actinidia rufa TaxID=165716 RepID=A0A7J0HEI7_9ERIC|nr:hypothetical protein Acr_29g0006140 [Actinidia rufa]
MGNYISMTSCTFISPTINNSKAARVIFPGGEIRQFREPAKAAEPMLERPGFFLVNSRSLIIGRRFSPLAADEDLEFCHLYVMFPMRRVNSVVTTADVAVIFMTAKSPAKRISGVGNGGVTPDSGESLTADTSTENGGVGSRLSLGDGEGFPAPEFKYRLAVCRSRRPGLDTITEEPLRSR